MSSLPSAGGLLVLATSAGKLLVNEDLEVAPVMHCTSFVNICLGQPVGPHLRSASPASLTLQETVQPNALIIPKSQGVLKKHLTHEELVAQQYNCYAVPACHLLAICVGNMFSVTLCVFG